MIAFDDNYGQLPVEGSDWQSRRELLSAAGAMLDGLGGRAGQRRAADRLSDQPEGEGPIVPRDKKEEDDEDLDEEEDQEDWEEDDES